MLQVRRRPAKNVISPPQNPPKKQQCKHQECLASIASYKKKLMTCARVRYRRRVDSVAASPREYLVRRAAKNVISPPQTPPKKQQCKHQECLASYKKKLMTCARVRCKRRVDSVAASPREYLVRRAAKNVISPPQNPPQPPPKKQQCKHQECLASYKKKVITCARVRCKRVDSVAASPREYFVRRAAKNVISPPKTTPKPPQNSPKPTAVYKPWSTYLGHVLAPQRVSCCLKKEHYHSKKSEKQLWTSDGVPETCAENLNTPKCIDFAKPLAGLKRLASFGAWGGGWCTTGANLVSGHFLCID